MPTLIIGADFTHFFVLVVNIRRCRLIDPSSNTFSFGRLTSSNYSKISVLDFGYRFSNALSDFPKVTGAKPAKSVKISGMFHHIKTIGRPVTERPRRLDPEKYEAAKREFEILVGEGECKFYKSPWVSPIHMIRKKDGSWRICDDYR